MGSECNEWGLGNLQTESWLKIISYGGVGGVMRSKEWPEMKQ